MNHHRRGLELGHACLVFTALAGATFGQEPVSAPAARAPKPLLGPWNTIRVALSPDTDPTAWPAAALVRLPGIDTAALLAEDAVAQASGGIPLRVGVNQPVPGTRLTPANSGTWTTRADGSRVWTLEIQAAGAKGLRVHFSQFTLANEARVVVAGRDGVAAREDRGRGFDGKGEFWSPSTAGEVALVEYLDPTGRAGDPTIEIDEVSRFYRDEPFEVAAPAAPTLLPCHVDVNCATVPQNARDAVGRMVFTIPGQGTFVCTGALLDDLDPNTFAGYFLTADHCINTQTAASSLQILWFYQTGSCNGAVSSGPTSFGATLLAHSSNSDFSFLRLADDPRDGQGMAAWTTAAPTGTVRGVHHPGGSYKRYSEGPVTTQQPICGSLPLTRFVYNDWTTGITEGGSSGSPLFNGNWEVVGQLFGTCSFNTPGCTNPQDYNNVYGRFATSYTSFSSYLTAVIPDDVYEDNDSLAAPATLAEGLHNLRLVDFDDYFSVTTAQAATVTVTATFATTDMDLDLYLLATDGTVIASSTGSASPKSVSAPVGAGIHIVRTYKAFGWGGDYSLTILSSASDCNGNGIDDNLDVTNLTSPDCDVNGFPDECQIAAGSGAPGGPFYCTQGCDPDCNDTGIPDACELSGNDANSNGVPDECDCQSPAAADADQILNSAGALVTSVKNRFLSFSSGATGALQAVRVRFVNLPGGFAVFNGTSAWVDVPQSVSELPGKGLTDPVGTDPTFMAARLTSAPVFADWSTFGVVHVFDERIIPSRKLPSEPLEAAVYEIQLVDDGCDLNTEANFSAPLSIINPRWGDVASLQSGQFRAPDGSIDVTADVLAVLAKFGNAAGAPSKPRAEMVGTGVSGPQAAITAKIDISDVLAVLAAFSGGSYPFPPPAF